MRLLVSHLIVLLSLPLSAAWAVSVENFGAFGNATADDTDAIQAALDAGQGPVLLPPGRYRITQTLRVPAGGGLYGQGTLYMDADETVLSNHGHDQRVNGILIKGIQIEKRFVENSEKDGIFFENATNLRIDGVSVTGMSACFGIALVRCVNFSITDCYVHDFKASWTKRKLPGGRSLDAIGIMLDHCYWGQITNNRIENLNVTYESAVAVHYQTDGINPRRSKQVTIANNIIRNVGEGIDLVDCESMSVTGNVIQQCWPFGIKVIHGSRLCTISNNTIRDAGLNGMSLYFGNPEFGPGFGNVVQGNTIANTGTIAITREKDGTRQGVWEKWPIAGIDLHNDSRANNSVYDYIIANNVIYNTPEHPICQYGINERYHTYGDEREDAQQPDPSLFTNKISGNLIRGMRVGKYKTFSTTFD